MHVFVLGKIFDKVRSWQFTIPQLEGIWGMKTMKFITDCLTILTPNLAGVD